MTNSATSTERGRSGRDLGIQPWHFYLLLALGGATWAVLVSRNTQPAALLLISALCLSAGLAGLALHNAVAGFFSEAVVATPAPISERTRETLEREKALVLRSIKELEFDHAMRKISDVDFAEIGGSLRARAIALLQELDRQPGPAPVTSQREPAARADRPPTPARDAQDVLDPSSDDARGLCASCGTANDADARFCKACGSRLS